MDNLREKFEAEYIDSPFATLRFNRLINKVYKGKITALWEANLDKLFFETQYAKELSYDDSSDRIELSNERKKLLADQDMFKISEIEERIGHNKAIKASYYKNENFRAEVKTYIKMLDLWKNPKSQNSDL